MLYFWYFHELIWLTHRNFYGLISCDVDMSYETALWSKLFLLFLSGRNCILNIYLRKREMISSLWRWGTQNLEWCSETKISNVCKIKAIHAVIFCIIRQLMSKGRALDLGFRINLPTKYLFISKVMCWQMKILHNVFPHNNYHWRCVFFKEFCNQDFLPLPHSGYQFDTITWIDIRSKLTERIHWIFNIKWKNCAPVNLCELILILESDFGRKLKLKLVFLWGFACMPVSCFVHDQNYSLSLAFVDHFVFWWQKSPPPPPLGLCTNPPVELIDYQSINWSWISEICLCSDDRCGLKFPPIAA